MSSDKTPKREPVIFSYGGVTRPPEAQAADRRRHTLAFTEKPRARAYDPYSDL